MTPTFIHCHECDRGGCGNAKDKCACGWKVDKPSGMGCFCGSPIIGEPRKPEKLSRSKERYQAYQRSEYNMSFGDYLKWKHGKKYEEATT